MSKKVLITVIVVIVLSSMLGLQIFGKNDNGVQTVSVDMNDFRFQSNRYTGVEEDNGFKQTYEIPENFKMISENEYLKLFVNEDTLAIKVVDKRTGYVWSSDIDDIREERFNEMWRNYVQGAVSIEYHDKNGKKGMESFSTEYSEVDLKTIDHGFSADIQLYFSDIALTLNVWLDGDKLNVEIPQESLKELKKSKIITLTVYPFFGATKEDSIPGYIFIPDGVGALIRFKENTDVINDPYVTKIYGRDYSLENIEEYESFAPPQKTFAPVFGMVHGVESQGFIASVDQGASYGEIVAYPAGLITDYNWIHTKYTFRRSYYQPTSKYEGVTAWQDLRNKFTILQQYMFLADDEADYIGMAKRYRQKLEEEDVLSKVNTKKDDIPIRVDFLGAESKKAAIGKETIVMTDLDAIITITNDLLESGIENLVYVYKGWAKGGLSETSFNHFPIEKKLGNNNDWSRLTNLLSENNIPLYFFVDYLTALNHKKDFNVQKDTIKKINKTYVYHDYWDDARYFINANAVLNKIKDEISSYTKHGAGGLALNTIGYTLTSDFRDENGYSREEAISKNSNILDEIQHNMKTAIVEPYHYLWDKTDIFLDMPLYSSQYIFADDTVPFLPVVLKGYLDYYSDYFNNASDKEEELLRLIEYGAYPSFIITEADSYKLQDTASRNIVSSKYDDWSEQIMYAYEIVGEALKKVQNATIEDRIIPKEGVVIVTYSNGTDIIINYTNEAFEYKGMQVGPRDFILTGVN